MKHLTKEQRYQIEAYLECGKSKLFIAKTLGFDKSTIYKEIKRNSTKRGKYRAEIAQMYSDEKKDRYNYPRKFNDTIKRFIDEKIEKEQWSPEQITGYCRKNNIPMVSHERIYQYIRQDKAVGGNKYKNLRHRLKHRKRPVSGKNIVIKDKVLIDQRPDVINKKQRFGDWEIDTIVGKENKGAIVTIVERKTDFLMMKKLVAGKNAKELSKALIDMLLPYKSFIHSITSDNGTEFADHKTISKKLNTDFYFAHPYSSWERGLNEYTNKLIRQYIPKKSKFDSLTDMQITEIQYKLNRRPRKNLTYETPINLFANLAS